MKQNIVSLKNSKLAYTLSEVIIVMLVIAVVVSVSIKITKTKFDNIISYTYYAGFSILRNVSSQIATDFKATDADYMNNSAASADEEQDEENCGGNTEYRWDANANTCLPEPSTIPRTGENFCKKFVSYANTRTGTECKGDSVAINRSDFSSITPDIVLRNGMKIYNISKNAGEIAELKDNFQGSAYDGVSNINTFGYTVYLDIDGNSGPSTLWQDVYRFYITMSGKVIPAYNAQGAGGHSIQHLMTSVGKESVTGNQRVMLWIKKSVSFKEGACAAKYISAKTPYCSGVSVSPQCNSDEDPCILKYVTPAKFFNKL